MRSLGWLALGLLSCGPAPELEVSPFGSGLNLPQGYSYQILISEGDALPSGERFTANNDLLAFVPIDAQTTYLSVNHETRPGGISLLILQKQNGLWKLSSGQKIDFKPVGGSWQNCSGTPTPWGTVLSAEEFPPSRASDIPAEMVAEGYSPDPLNYGWMVEVDPRSGAAHKRRAMGRFSHEGAAVLPDQQTVFLSEDAAGGHLYRFVADRPRDLSSGSLYALDAQNRRWLEIPATELEQARPTASRLGATPFNRPEDIEYNPVDGWLYWAETGDLSQSDPHGRVWRLHPQTLQMQVFVEGSASGLSQPDNLAIEPGSGRVWIHEDRFASLMAPTPSMPNNSLWVASLSGQIKRFASMPPGAEVTGGAFAPDGRLFFSVMHPNPPWRSSVVQILPK